MSPSGPPGQFDWTKLAHCTSRSCVLQNKTTIRPLRHILRILFDEVPLRGPRGSGLDQNCTCTTRPWGQQNLTINRSLRYLVTEEIEVQDIDYGQTDARTTDERVSHMLTWSSTSKTKNEYALRKHRKFHILKFSSVKLRSFVRYCTHTRTCLTLVIEIKRFNTFSLGLKVE